jgi:hypothetical protein
VLLARSLDGSGPNTGVTPRVVVDATTGNRAGRPFRNRTDGGYVRHARYVAADRGFSCGAQDEARVWRRYLCPDRHRHRCVACSAGSLLTPRAVQPHPRRVRYSDGAVAFHMSDIAAGADVPSVAPTALPTALPTSTPSGGDATARARLSSAQASRQARPAPSRLACRPPCRPACRPLCRPAVRQVHAFSGARHD